MKLLRHSGARVLRANPESRRIVLLVLDSGFALRAPRNDELFYVSVAE